MKNMILVFILALTMTTPAMAADYVCKLTQRLGYVDDYEDINDFSFEESPYLILKSKESGIFAVTLGQMSFEDGEDFIVIRESTINGQKVIQTFYVEEEWNFELTRITFLDREEKTARVESLEPDREGEIAEFGNCHQE